MFRNTIPRYEVLSEDAMATLDKGWRRLMTEIGVEFMDGVREIYDGRVRELVHDRW